jgi:hypothetical protein
VRREKSEEGEGGPSTMLRINFLGGERAQVNPRSCSHFVGHA